MPSTLVLGASASHTTLIKHHLAPVALDLTVTTAATRASLFEDFTTVISAAGVAYGAPLDLAGVDAEGVARAAAAAEDGVGTAVRGSRSIAVAPQRIRT